jgi:hypothetical protein
MGRRYVRRGSDIPEIYPGDLKGLTRAMKDAQDMSASGLAFTVSLHEPPGPSRVLRLYEDGRLSWAPGPGEEEGS